MERSQSGAQLAKLLSPLTSMNCDFYSTGIICLYEMYTSLNFIKRSDYLERLREAFDTSVVLRSETIDTADATEEEANELHADPYDPRARAGFVFRRLHEAGWFEIFYDNIDGVGGDSLVIGARQARWAHTLKEDYETKQRERASSILQAKNSIAEAAQSHEKLVEAGLAATHTDRERVADELNTALIVAREKGEEIIRTLRRGIHDYKLFEIGLRRIRRAADFTPYFNSTYLENLRDKLLDPLLDKDGIDWLTGQIIAKLDLWATSDEILGLVVQSRHKDDGQPLGSEEAARQMRAVQREIIETRGIYAIEIARTWDYIGWLDTVASKEVNVRYQYLMGARTDLSRMCAGALAKMLSPDQVESRCATNAMGRAVERRCAPPSPILPASLSTLKVRETVEVAEATCPVGVEEEGFTEEDIRKKSRAHAIGARFAKIARGLGGTVDSAMLAESYGISATDLALAMVDASSRLPAVDLAGLTDETRVPIGSGTVPLASFAPAKDTKRAH